MGSLFACTGSVTVFSTWPSTYFGAFSSVSASSLRRPDGTIPATPGRGLSPPIARPRGPGGDARRGAAAHRIRRPVPCPGSSPRRRAPAARQPCFLSLPNRASVTSWAAFASVPLDVERVRLQLPGQVLAPARARTTMRITHVAERQPGFCPRTGKAPSGSAASRALQSSNSAGRPTLECVLASSIPPSSALSSSGAAVPSSSTGGRECAGTPAQSCRREQGCLSFLRHRELVEWEVGNVADHFGDEISVFARRFTLQPEPSHPCP